MRQFSGLSAVPAAREPALPVFAFEHVDAFLGKARPVTRTWFTKLSCLRCFFRYAVSRGYITTAPLPTVMPKHPPAFVPYIYTREELRRLLQVIESYPRASSTLEPATIRTMILVYYGAGLRLREATNLTRADVDLSGSVLTIRNTKFGKTRLVPVGPQLNRALVQYDRTRPPLRRKIGRREGGMFEHRHQHGRHADHRIAAVGREEFEHEAGFERLQQHLCRSLGHGAEHAADAAAGVEQRHGGDEDVAGVDPHAIGGVGAVVGEAAMMQQRAFRKAGGARGILDHHGIAWV